MRRLTLLAFVLSAHATWTPVFSETIVVLHPGEHHQVGVTRRWSGITDYGFSGWEFFSDDENMTVAVIAERVPETLYVAGPRTLRVGQHATYTALGPDVSAGATYQWYSGEV